ncbi:uncharacterized protein MONOS_8368 [Monocercomonoides exilis]|uniref:uncharacterized protein n=1 Tax=Monocercomonoides exilis TaxID=2049356 RepID=UPI003559FEA5|nr:hypothetical protein MONOS_8368 [Monocercomonoides exilis]|eukprot:MONOS_8368.1-p1 / transcript=MONOS_8368.1 / gene=MONOS_8368 / organism=Monocercomonoides_exilis_PA203 / gene_product=unspecified product / transcript_product=unspecified product / location=Mono_scaffold00314:21002-22261(-) / protein_length=357 / sequence_SO=supercontig / SO=protein_coding / is_pseudo=false
MLAQEKTKCEFNANDENMLYFGCNAFLKKQATSVTKGFNELLHELEHCTDSEQKQKIEEMDEIIDGMNKEEFTSVFSEELSFKIDKMIDEKKLLIENALLLLKHVGYCNTLKGISSGCFNHSKLNKKVQKMIIDENEKKEETDENLLVELCECNIFFNHYFSTELLSICLHCLVKAALKKEKKEKQKEVEIALLALSKIGYNKIDKELYLNEMKEIIQYHREHRNLTYLAHQSTWRFLISRLFQDRSLGQVIMNELHFGRVAVRELEELRGNVDWKRKEEEKEERRKDKKKELVILRWLGTLEEYFLCFKLWNAEFVWLIGSMTRLFRASRDNYGEISEQCFALFKRTTDLKQLKS